MFFIRARLFFDDSQSEFIYIKPENGADTYLAGEASAYRDLNDLRDSVVARAKGIAFRSFKHLTVAFSSKDGCISVDFWHVFANGVLVRARPGPLSYETDQHEIESLLAEYFSERVL